MVALDATKNSFQTLVMFTLRIIFFRLYESPRYLVAAGRSADAVAALQSIEDYNMKCVIAYYTDISALTICPTSLDTAANPLALDL